MISILLISNNEIGTFTGMDEIGSFLEKKGIEAKVKSCSFSEAPGYINLGIDVAVCSKYLIPLLYTPEETQIVGIKNWMDEGEYGPLIMSAVESLNSEAQCVYA